MSASGSHIVSSRFRGAAENTLPPVAGAKERVTWIRLWRPALQPSPRWSRLGDSDHLWPPMTIVGIWNDVLLFLLVAETKKSSNWGCCRIPLLAYMVALAMVLVSRDALKLQNSFLMVSINVVNRMPKTIPKKCMLFFCLGCLLSPNGSCLYRLMALGFPHQTINFWGFVLTLRRELLMFPIFFEAMQRFKKDADLQEEARWSWQAALVSCGTSGTAKRVAARMGLNGILPRKQCKASPLDTTVLVRS